MSWVCKTVATTHDFSGSFGVFDSRILNSVIPNIGFVILNIGFQHQTVSKYKYKQFPFSPENKQKLQSLSDKLGLK